VITAATAQAMPEAAEEHVGEGGIHRQEKEQQK
jgi:hypothetical protein